MGGVVVKGNADGYLILEDKCAVSRNAFTRCIVHHREVMEGRRKDADWDLMGICIRNWVADHPECLQFKYLQRGRCKFRPWDNTSHLNAQLSSFSMCLLHFGALT